MMGWSSPRIGSRPPPQAIPRKPGLHLGTYRRLCRERERLVNALADLPRRRLEPGVDKRLRTQFENRLARVTRALGLRVPGPRRQPRYRIGQAAAILRISQKTLLRWVEAGRAHCERRGQGHRRFADQELRRLLRAQRP